MEYNKRYNEIKEEIKTLKGIIGIRKIVYTQCVHCNDEYNYSKDYPYCLSCFLYKQENKTLPPVKPKCLIVEDD